MSIPNILSIIRIVLVPIFALTFLLLPDQSHLAAVVLLISGFTDLLDGYIARRFNQVTQLGKLLDPLADKLTQLVACVCLAIRHKEFIIILCLLIVKEIIMLIAGYKLIRQGQKLPSSKWFGKVATVVFYFVMVIAVFDASISNMLLAVLVWTAVVFAVLAFILYIPEFKKLNQPKTKKPNN